VGVIKQPLFKEVMNVLNPVMVRQAHHERIRQGSTGRSRRAYQERIRRILNEQQFTVRSELVEE